MPRALVFATLLSLIPGAAVQTPSVVHIKVVLVGADGKATPVPRYPLLISDNPVSAPPRRIVTTLDGTVDVRLRPGNYTVESERPITFQGKAHTWMLTLDITAGRNAVLELTTANAEIEETTATPAAGTTLESDPYSLVPKWQDSVVAIWTPTAHASAFVIDAKGLLATNQRVVGAAPSVEVQLTPTVKVSATVLASDPAKDVAVLWMDPQPIATTKPVPLACGQGPKPVVASGHTLRTSRRDERDVVGVSPPWLGERDFETGPLEQLEQLAVAVSAMRAAPNVDMAVRDERVLDLEPLPRRIVLIGDQQPHVVDLPPRPVANVSQKVLEDHRCFQHEPRTRLQR
jgi:hypothetical protein